MPNSSSKPPYAKRKQRRVDTLPLDPGEWDVVNQNRPIEHQAVCVKLRYETKGRSHGEGHGDKIGPEGDILLPMPMAMKLHEHRQKVRPKALTIRLRKAKMPMRRKQ